MKEIVHCGDNLEFMKTLTDKSIDLIYCDILYCTGRDFGDYKDIKSDRKTVEDFYIPRITEMHRLLKDTGNIYLQMDTRINHYLRLILEEIFGAKNFRNEIVWKRRGSPMNIFKNSGFHNNYDVILFFSKTDNCYFKNQYKPLSEETIKRYNKKDNKGYYILQGLIGKGYNKEIELIFNNKNYTGAYRWTQETLNNRIKEGYIIEENTKGNLSYRGYLNDSKGSYVADIWDDLTNENFNGQINDNYETQKSIELMARIINASSKEGDVCADFFCGSGSFGIASKKLNRNIILCDISKKAISQTKKRLKLETNLFNNI